MALSVSIEFVSSSARVTSVKFQKGIGLTQFERSRPIDRTPGIPGSDKNMWKMSKKSVSLAVGDEQKGLDD